MYCLGSLLSRLFSTYIFSFSGPRPGPPRNVTVRQQKNGLLISWLPPLNTSVPVSYYVIHYRTVGRWVPLTNQIEGGKTWFLWTTASRGATYHFQVYSYSTSSRSTPSKVHTYHTGGRYTTSTSTLHCPTLKMNCRSLTG